MTLADIDWAGWLVWGFAGTVVLTTILAAGQGLGLTRMSIPYMIGSIFTPDRDRGRLIGIGLHLVNGWVFSLVYIAAFHLWGGATWWKGATIGLVHGAFVLAVVMPALPAMHPRMASEIQGPTVVRQLEPPGFLALHYGTRTPLAAAIAHVAYGIVLGAFYQF
jgi:uncharacterized membrane protein YagU involved in acid resistance